MKASGGIKLAWSLKVVLDIAWSIGVLIGIFLVIIFIFTMITPGSPINLYTLQEGWETEPGYFDHNIKVSTTDPSMSNVEIPSFLAIVELKTQDRLFLFIFYLFYMSYWAVTLLIILQLRNFLESVTDGSPFTRENAVRIRTIGWAIVAAWIARMFYLVISKYYMLKVLKIEGARLPSLSIFATDYLESLRLGFLLVGILVLIVAHIFKIGVDMKEEQDLTV